MTTKVLHEDGEKYTFSHVSVQIDGKTYNLPVEKGTVEVSNQKELEALTEKHGKFFAVDEDAAEELPDYVLADKNVGQVREYVNDINDIERLKELRKKESESEGRKTALEAIDSRIEEVKQNLEEDEVVEEEEDENESVEEDEDESNETEDA